MQQENQNFLIQNVIVWFEIVKLSFPDSLIKRVDNQLNLKMHSSICLIIQIIPDNKKKRNHLTL